MFQPTKYKITNWKTDFHQKETAELYSAGEASDFIILETHKGILTWLFT